MFLDLVYFVIFLMVIGVLYFFVKKEIRWLIILISSYLFYSAWAIEFIPLLIISTLLTFIFGICIAKTNSPKSKKFFLILGLLSSLGMLAVA